jgi:nicotinamide-nucleotide amidase
MTKIKHFNGKNENVIQNIIHYLCVQIISILKAIILTVGDEILIGQVVDTNSAWLGSTLNEIGIDILEILSVSDDIEAIKQGIAYSLDKADIVLMTGGLGPTKDDITKTSIAAYFGVDFVFSEETYERIVKIFAKYGRTISESHKDQCLMPANAELLHNKMGTAPGMLFRQNDKLLISMPGVPFEMKAIVTDELMPILKSMTNDVNIMHQTIMTSGEGESFIEDTISPLITDMPSYIKLAYLPSLGYVRLRLTGRHHNTEELKREIIKYTNIITTAIGTLVVCEGDVSLEEYMLTLFKNKKLSLSTAESCTGGYLAHRLTSIPGSSAYFMGSVVSYSNDIKNRVLGVAQSTLDNHGAVSEETVKEMVQGLLKVTQTDIGVSISGIAGPDGGTLEKPVGTIWMAIGSKDQIKTFKIAATKDRLKNIEYAANVAMNKIRLFVEGH